MRKSKGNSGEICGKSAKQLIKILVCRKYSEMALLYYLFLVGNNIMNHFLGRFHGDLDLFDPSIAPGTI
jgi:hypothetical protein